MHALVLLYVNQHTKFEVSGFTNYKDMIWAKFKKRSCDRDHAPFVVYLSPYARISYSLPACTI